ncbi:interleukin-17D-like [Brienomyrus brachyistius]|uniref:interleukin-17D-like n=1 Tax=Brienomyrus brachyistius TaxID=42636 RepID=UPI0020B3F1F3|nr:interleukin-17D-like [Brienomyrus brachyistius]XP_048830149.1 interleukin-17D-like [Brienomyrus brachyistius]
MLSMIPIVLIIFLLGEITSVAKSPKKQPRTRQCSDLPEEILEQTFGRLSAGVLSAFHHTLQLSPLERENLTCPSAGHPMPRKNSSLPINVVSISPWAYRISHDLTRYPRLIPEAYCLCKGCLTRPFGEESHLYRSMPIYMPFVILRRTTSCSGGHYSYTESYVSIPVGCTCVPLQDKNGYTSDQNLKIADLETKVDKSNKHL